MSPTLPRGARVRKHLGYLRRYPGVMPRAAVNYLRLLALRRPVLRGVELAVTFRCNCACEHCSAARLRAQGGQDPSTAQVLDAIRQCRGLGALNINLTGGEALFRDDLEAIVRGAGPRSAVVSLATNGVLLSSERARSLARAGLSIVTISLDAADPAEHDRRRGHPGCFEAALAAAEHAQAAGIQVFFCTILMKHQIADGQAERLVELAGERGAMLTVNVPWAVGGWEQQDQVLLGPDELETFRALVARPGVRWEGCSNYLREGCPAGIEKIYVTADGEVMPCTGLHRSFGNLHRQPLAEIWAAMRAREPFGRVNPGCLAADPDFQRGLHEDPR